MINREKYRPLISNLKTTHMIIHPINFNLSHLKYHLLKMILHQLKNQKVGKLKQHKIQILIKNLDIGPLNKIKDIIGFYKYIISISLINI